MKICSAFLVFLILSSCLYDQKEQFVSLLVPKNSIQNYRSIGDSISEVLLGALMKNINDAIKEKGETYAIEFCNLKVIELTDSLSNRYNCIIRRVSLNNRNPGNEPFDIFEKDQLEKYESYKLKNKPLNDEIRKKNDAVFYFKPIFIASETCLKCHGEKGRDIELATEIKLYKYYPFDKAIDYKVNDLRGMWSIKFLDSINK